MSHSHNLGPANYFELVTVPGMAWLAVAVTVAPSTVPVSTFKTTAAVTDWAATQDTAPTLAWTSSPGGEIEQRIPRACHSPDEGSRHDRRDRHDLLAEKLLANPGECGDWQHSFLGHPELGEHIMPWLFNITAATVVKATPGTIMTVSVIVPGSAVGSVNDCATTGAAAASNQLATIPMIPDTANGVIEFNNGACVAGIVVVPGSGMTVAAEYF